MKICGVYKVTHRESGGSYIGKSIDIHRRWREHVRDAETGRYKTRFYNALRKYGRDAFDWEILCECAVDDLDATEMEQIAIHKMAFVLFNHTPGGDGLRAGSKHSEAANIAKSLRQRGKPHSAEHNRKVSEAQKGKIVPQWIIDKMNAAKAGKTPYFSPLHRKRISEAKRGKKMPVGALSKAWETRRQRYGESGLSGVA